MARWRIQYIERGRTAQLSPLTETLTVAMAPDEWFIARFSSEGAPDWLRPLSNGDLYLNAVTTSASGTVAVGYLDGTATFAGANDLTLGPFTTSVGLTVRLGP